MEATVGHFILPIIGVLVALILFLVLVSRFVRIIGPNRMGIKIVNFTLFGKKSTSQNPIALDGEPGYQPDILRPGMHFVWWPFENLVLATPPQVPANTVAVVVAQVGQPLPDGAKTAAYKPIFGKFTDVRTFIKEGGQKGVQQPVLQSGELEYIHPVAFLVLTVNGVHGIPVTPEYAQMAQQGNLTLQAFGITPEDLHIVEVGPREIEVEVVETTENAAGEQVQRINREMRMVDHIGIVTTLDGPAPEKGDIACRIKGFADVEEIEKEVFGNTVVAKAPTGTQTPEQEIDNIHSNLVAEQPKHARLLEQLLNSKNDIHESYQNYPLFLKEGGRMGMQHDPILTGRYAFNPFCVKVEFVPMLTVNQGEVATIKAFLGLPTVDTSGKDFKHGMIVRPGHKGLWEVSLGPGKYPLNPHIYQPVIVKTYILNLSWAEARSSAHTLDHQLSQIVARSSEGFIFKVDLQVQIHVPDVMAARVIAMVGTMENLVNEVLHPAVGNHFRDKLQGMTAVKFIATRQMVQEEAFRHIQSALRGYYVEVRGVYIQDVIPDEKLIAILSNRELAAQNALTYEEQEKAENKRATMENAKGRANKQGDLAGSLVEVDIKDNKAKARANEGRGEAEYTERTGKAAGAEPLAVGMAYAEAYHKQVAALGPFGTALVNAVQALSKGTQPFVPQIMAGGGMDGLIAMFMKNLNNGNGINLNPATPATVESAVATEALPVTLDAAPEGDAPAAPKA